MDDDFDLRDFSNVVWLFPLPNVVLFPHAVLPLHIFEPRYRQMTEDSLATDSLVAIANLRPSVTESSLGMPPIERIGCLGRILQHERLDDGRFNFLLLGRKRIRLRHEIASDKLYRIAQVEIMDDEAEPDESTEALRDEVAGMFRAVFQKQRPLDSELGRLLEKSVPLGVMTDIIGHALGLPSELKQALLGETRVADRGRSLARILREMIAHDPALAREFRTFPPPFSVN